MGYDGTVTIGTLIDTTGIEAGLKNIEKTITAKTKGLQKSINRIFIGAGLLVGIRAITKELGTAVDRLDTMKNYVNVMSNLGIGSEEAEASIKRLNEALDGLPTTLNDAALSVQRFTSANGNVKASTEIFLALNNAILAGGASMQVQSTALEQLSQAYTKGKPDMMEWRTAMTAMPAQLTQVAKVMGFVNAAQLGESLRKGKTSMNEFMTTLVKMNKQGIGGFKSLEEQARNATGGIGTSITNLKTAIARGLANIMDAIGRSNIVAFFDAIRHAIDKVVPYIAGFVKALLMLFGIGKNTSSSTDKASKSLNNLGTSGAKTSKGLDKATGSATALNKQLKQLASFDEMNVLQENKSSSSGGSGGINDPSLGLGGIDTSAFDLATTGIDSFAKKAQEVAEKILPFLKLIANNWDSIVAAIIGAKVALGLFSLGLNGILSLGIGVIIAGIIKYIINFISYLKDPTWQNFNKMMSGLSTILIGIGIAMLAIPGMQTIGIITLLSGAVARLIGGFDGLIIVLAGVSGVLIGLNAANPIGWIGAAVAVVGSIVSAFGQWGKKTDETKQKLVDAKTATDNLKKAQQELASQTETYTNAVKNAEKTQKDLEEAEKKNKLSGEELFRAVQLGTLDYKNMNEKQREVFDAYVANKEAQDKLTEATDKFTEAQKGANQASGELSGAVYNEKKEYDKYMQALIDGYKKAGKGTDEFYQGMNSALKNMDEKSRQTFLENLPADVQEGLKTYDGNIMQYPYVFGVKMGEIQKTAENTFETDVPNSVKKGLTSSAITTAFSNFKSKFNNMINGLNTDVSVNASVKTTKSSGGTRAKGGIFYPGKLPKLAVGGIINQPGRGVPYNGAYIGERGAEAVVPLTDSQQMALLGEAIGKYITITANITNTMNGRVISRELQKINTENDFAYNR